MYYHDFIREKLSIKRSLYFFIGFIVLVSGLATMLHYEEASVLDMKKNIFGLFGRFFYLFMLVLLAGEKGSGFLAKQLTNGLSRKSAFIYFQLLIFGLTLLFYLLTLISFFVFSQIQVYGFEFMEAFLLSFLSFWCLSQLVFLIILYFQKTITAILVAYFLILGIDSFAFTLLPKYLDPNLMFLFPHSLALNLPLLYGSFEYSVAVTVLLAFIVLVGTGSYFKLLKSDLI